MRAACLVAVCLWGCVCRSVIAWGEEPEVRVYCPAISFDNHDDRNRNVPEGPSEVLLMVVGRIEKPPAPKKDPIKPQEEDRLH